VLVDVAGYDAWLALAALEAMPFEHVGKQHEKYYNYYEILIANVWIF
jgi:hypothetical protein